MWLPDSTRFIFHNIKPSKVSKSCFCVSGAPHPRASAGPPHSWGPWWTCWWGGSCSPPAAERSEWGGPELLPSRRPPPAPAPALTRENTDYIFLINWRVKCSFGELIWMFFWNSIWWFLHLMLLQKILLLTSFFFPCKKCQPVLPANTNLLSHHLH